MARSIGWFFTRIMLLHVLLLAVLIGFPFFRDLFKPKKKEMVTYVNLHTVVAQPEPPPPVTPEPEIKPPTPEPPPAPVKKKAVKKKIKKSKKRVKRKKSEPEPKPKPKPRPRINPDELRKALESEVKTKSTSEVDPMTSYYALIRPVLNGAWMQPRGMASMRGRSALVDIRVERSGQVLSWKLSRSSGNTTFDQSVELAMTKIKQLRPLPSSIRDRFKDITVYFEME